MKKQRAVLLRVMSFGRLRLVEDAAHAERVGDCWFEQRGRFEHFFVATEIGKNPHGQEVFEVEQMSPPGGLIMALSGAAIVASAWALWYWLA